MAFIPFIDANAIGTIESKIDDAIIGLIDNQNENVTVSNTTALTKQLEYLYEEHYDCSKNNTTILEDSCDVAVSKNTDGLTIF